MPILSSFGPISYPSIPFSTINEAIPFYCIARGANEETTEAFYRLVFEGGGKKAYLSFPMTHVGPMEGVREAIGEFRKVMKGCFTCFDPADLEEFITSGPVAAVLIEGEDAIQLVRTMMGATSHLQSAPGTIRGDLALSTQQNLIHGSDSPESAQREIPLFFSDNERY